MDRESEYLFRLMGAYVRGEAPGDAHGVEPEKLKHLAYIHYAAGILGHMVMQYGLFPDHGAPFRQECMVTILRFGQRAALAQAVFEALEEAGIDYLPMKGYVVKDYYPVPELRTYGDIDLLIRPADREKCHRLMLDRDYGIKTDWEPVYSYVKPMEHYEFHTELLETDITEELDCRAYFSDPWRHAVNRGGHHYEFSPEFHFMYLVAHLAKHVAASGAGARMYLDLGAFILHFGPDADWVRIRADLEKTGLAGFANTALTFVEKYMGVASPIDLEPVEEEVLEALASMTAHGGIFGKSDLDSGVNAMNSHREGSRVRTVLRRLFPAAKTIRRRYTYLQKCPWLLPAAWVHRLFLTRKTWTDHAREARSIMDADMEKVRRVRSLHGAIGLGKDRKSGK